MKPPCHNPDSHPGLDALTELYRVGLPGPDRADLNQGLAGVRTRLALRKTRRKRRVHWVMAGAGATLALMVALVASSWVPRPSSPPRSSSPMPPPPLTYHIEGGDILKGGYLRESGHSGIRLRFSEGSQLAFDPGARGRLRSIDTDRPRVAVDHGRASFRIHKSEGRRWLVEAGPFLVMVKGTIFSVAWDPSGERFDLRLRQGHVTVSGPTSKADIDLESGQRLMVNLAKAETVISEDRPEEGDATAAASQAPGPVGLAPRRATRPRPAPKAAATPASATAVANKAAGRWAEDFAQGHWDRIITDAENSGVDAILDKASLEDLFVLADAARYRHRPDLARAALLAERRRFPGSPRTLAATFLLGRVEESNGGRSAQALAWYDAYLALAPTGPLAAEALGRKMMLTAKLHAPGRARPLAEEYLRRFPNGSYARSARLLQAPSDPGTP